MTFTRRSKIPSEVAVTMIDFVAFFPEAQYEDADEESRSGMEAYLDAGAVGTVPH